MSRPEPIATLDSALAAFQAEAADAERRVMNFENAHADTLRELRDLQHEHSDAVRKAAATRNAIQNLGYLPSPPAAMPSSIATASRSHASRIPRGRGAGSHVT